MKTGVVIGATAIAGCLGNGDEPDNGGDEDQTETTQTTDTTDSTGELAVSAEPSATEIDWGDEYSVHVTVQAGNESPEIATAIIYQTEDDSSWSGSFSNTEKMWRVDAGETATETFLIEPPAVGTLTLGLINVMNEEVVEEWELTVQPPTGALDEPISYYDGLDMTVDAEIHDSLEFELDYGGSMNEAESGMFSVSVRDGKWVKVIINAVNTKEEGKVDLPGEPEFSGLAGGTSLVQNQPRSLGEGVGEGTIYAIGDGPSDIDDAWMEMHKDGVVQQEGYWYPPSEIAAGAREDGWLVYAVQEDLADDSAIEIRLDRNGVDVRATWTNE